MADLVDEVFSEEEPEEFDDLPAFANEVNKQLHAQVREREKVLAQTEAELEDTKERIGVMEEHLGSVKTEQLHTQRLVDSKIKEIETEDHLKQLAERERGRFHAEFNKLTIEIAELQDKINGVQNSVFKGNEKMEQFKLQMNWNQEELEQWALAARQKEEDNLALLKYTKTDESKMKELNLQLEKMVAAVQTKKAELETEVTDTQSKQIELDKTAEDFRALHRERQELVVQWEQAVEAMQSRDETIKRAHEEFAEAKRDLREKQEALNEKEEFLQTEQKNNSEVDLVINNLERQVGRKREHLVSEGKRLEELADQVEVVRSTLSKAASEMAQTRSQCSDLVGDIDTRKMRLDRAKKKLAQAEKSMERSRTHTGDLEKSAKQVEELHASEEAALRAAEKELVVLKEKIFKQGEVLSEARREEANIEAEISGADRSSRNASNRIKQLDEQAQRQRELVYAADFQLQLMERKVARATGVRSASEQRELHKKIADLTKQLEEQHAQRAMLDTQCKRLSNDLKQAKRKELDSTHESARLAGTTAELEMRNDAGQRQVRELVKGKEQGMVATDVLKLEVKRLRELLSAKADEVFGLQNRKFQLQMSMEERQQEIKVHTEVLRAQLKASNEERHTAARELSERLIKVDRLNNKYDIICGRMGADGDDGDGEHTQAYYVIKAAQEREELQRQGDELDQQIQKSEREIRALEKTLGHLFAKNAGYKKTFTPVSEASAQFEQKSLLEEQHRAALSKYRSQRLEQSELEEEMQRLQSRAEELNDEKSLATTQLMDVSDQSSKLHDSLRARGSKLERVKENVQRLMNDHRRAMGASAEETTALELQVAHDDTRAAGLAVVQGLTQLAMQDPRLAPVIERKMVDAGIQPPGPDDFVEEMEDVDMSQYEL